MAEMSDVKLLSLITRRDVDPEDVEKIKRALFLPELIDMGHTVGVMRDHNDGKKCRYSDNFRMYEGEGRACRNMMKLDESNESIRRRYDEKMIEKMMEFARKAVDKELNKRKKGKSCTMQARSTYGDVYLEGKNKEVCKPYSEAQALIVEKDRKMATVEKVRRNVIKKHLKAVKPKHLQKGKVRFKK